MVRFAASALGHGMLVIKSGEDIVAGGVAVEKIFSLDLGYCSSRGPKCTTL